MNGLSVVLLSAGGFNARDVICYSNIKHSLIRNKYGMVDTCKLPVQVIKKSLSNTGRKQCQFMQKPDKSALNLGLQKEQTNSLMAIIYGFGHTSSTTIFVFLTFYSCLFYMILSNLKQALEQILPEKEKSKQESRYSFASVSPKR